MQTLDRFDLWLDKHLVTAVLYVQISSMQMYTDGQVQVY